MASLEEFLEEWNNDSPYVEVKTSGSTGEPKRMMVEKKRMLNSARITCDFLGLHEGDTALLCMSLDYIAGKMMVVRSIERGLRLISVEPSGHPLFRPPLAPPTQEGNSHLSPLTSHLSPLTSHLSFAAMVPMQVYNSLQVPEEKERLMQIKHLIIGGGAIDEGMERELRGFPNAVWSTYGMTETLSHIALRRISGPEASEWYTPFPSVEISQSPDGCLIINAPEVCPETLVTNDIVEIEDSIFPPKLGGNQRGLNKSTNKRFRILGRKDNVICSGGIKLQIEEIERELKPYVRVPYIISKRKDEKFGEIVVLLTEGSIEEAKAICDKYLPKYHIPKVYLHVDRIPLTETGKPARKTAEKIACSDHP